MNNICNFLLQHLFTPINLSLTVFPLNTLYFPVLIFILLAAMIRKKYYSIQSIARKAITINIVS
jgi:hypothetical protein